MTALETRIYTHPPVPLADISPLEHLILTHVLECSETEDGLVLFTDLGSVNPVPINRTALISAWRASADYAKDPFSIFIASRVLSLVPAPDEQSDVDTVVDIDLGAFPWQFIVQGIVARSKTVNEMRVVQWMNHPSQRPESFGASVSLITANAIRHATSEDLLARFRLQELSAASSTPDAESAIDFGVREVETALCIWEAMLYFRGLHEAGRPVPESIIAMSNVWDTAGWQAMRSHVRDLVPLALDVYDDLSEDLEEEGFTFDFDFAPAFVESLLWSENGARREGEPEEFLKDVITAVRCHRHDVIARAVALKDQHDVVAVDERGPMSCFKATIDVLVEAASEAEACDCIAETLRPHLREFSPGSSLIDWRYAGRNGDPEPHDGSGFEYASEPERSSR